MADEHLNRSGIYCIRNLVSGRHYVGSAVRIRNRWREHRHRLRRGTHHSPILQRSWNKHGEALFAFEVLEIVDDVKLLIAREQHWIDTLHAACPARGLNAYPKAGSPLGTKASLATKAKMSAYRKGRKLGPMSEEHKAKVSAAKMGTTASEEARRKQSLARKGKPLSPERAAKHRAMLIARNQSEEHRAKIRGAGTGRKQSEESRRKLSMAMKGRKLPPRSKEHAAAISAGRRAHFRRKAMGEQLALPF